MSIPALNIRGRLLYNEPLHLHTSLKVGGPADLYAIPQDADDLQGLLRQLKDHDIPWMSIGRGYNLLVRDGGIRGALISLELFNRITHEGEGVIRCEAGAENLSLIRFAQQLGRGGIGFIAGIPGTIGGAVKMNAGAYGSGILERVTSLRILRGTEIIDSPVTELKYSYRHLELPEGDIILSALFDLPEWDSGETEKEILKDLELRRTKHNVGFPSAGSFFKNPAGQAAWRLIDNAGMRGAQSGGAQVSEIHSNFLVNRGGAAAADFLNLSQMVKKAVLESSGIALEEEVRIVGEEK